MNFREMLPVKQIQSKQQLPRRESQPNTYQNANAAIYARGDEEDSPSFANHSTAMQETIDG